MLQNSDVHHFLSEIGSFDFQTRSMQNSSYRRTSLLLDFRFAADSSWTWVFKSDANALLAPRCQGTSAGKLAGLLFIHRVSCSLELPTNSMFCYKGQKTL